MDHPPQKTQKTQEPQEPQEPQEAQKLQQPQKRPDPDTERRRDATLALSEVLRQVIDQVVSTETPAGGLEAAVAAASELLGHLSGPRRPLSQLPSLDATVGVGRIFNPVLGPGNPMSPPMRYQRAGAGITATATFGPSYEGPPAFVHGGMLAMVFDEVLGRAAVEAGRWGMTGELTVRYLRPVPLSTPLVFTGQVGEEKGRRTILRATVATQAEPGVVLAQSSGVFFALTEDHRQRYFGHITHADGTSATDFTILGSEGL